MFWAASGPGRALSKVFVCAVAKEGAASLAGVQVGDELYALNGSRLSAVPATSWGVREQLRLRCLQKLMNCCAECIQNGVDMRLDIRRRLPANGASEVTLLSSSPSEFPSDAQELSSSI